MPKRIMRTFDRVELGEYVATGDDDVQLPLDAIAELLFICSNRARARWTFSRIEPEDGVPGVFYLHFDKAHDS